MKKQFLALLAVGVVAAQACIGLTACGKKNDTTTSAFASTFGQFAYNGNYLKEYATKSITASEAKARFKAILTPQYQQ